MRVCQGPLQPSPVSPGDGLDGRQPEADRVRLVGNGSPPQLPGRAPHPVELGATSRRDRPGAVLPPRCHHPHAHGALHPDQPEEQEEIWKCMDVVQRKSPVKHHPQSVLGTFQ